MKRDIIKIAIIEQIFDMLDIFERTEYLYDNISFLSDLIPNSIINISLKIKHSDISKIQLNTPLNNNNYYNKHNLPYTVKILELYQLPEILYEEIDERALTKVDLKLYVEDNPFYKNIVKEESYLSDIMKKEIYLKCEEKKYRVVELVSNNNIILKCDKDHEHSTNYISFVLKNIECPVCERNKRIENYIERILIKCKEKNVTFKGFVGGYTGFENITLMSKIILICNKDGHKWTPVINTFINDRSNCPVCTGYYQKFIIGKFTKEEIIQKVLNQCKENNYIFKGFEKEFKNSKCTLVLECPKHGVFKKSYHDFINKKIGCHDCVMENKRKKRKKEKKLS